MISENLTSFLQKPVEVYSPKTGIANPATTVYRIAVSYDDEDLTMDDLIESFLADPKVGQVQELIIGHYNNDGGEPISPVIDKLVAAKDVLKGLKALFIGDIISEECEISWIQQTNLQPLLDSYPALEYFQARGGDGLSLGQLNHNSLKTLIIETGGMPPNVIEEVSAAHLPNLERLDLWLGSDNYGYESEPDDFNVILSGERFPKLKHLGLKNSEVQDELAIAVSKAPILAQLKVLDLSMGTLTDTGAAALLNNPGIQQLEFLNLRRHYLSDKMIAQVKAIGVRVDVEEQEKDDDGYRYAEVTE